jgi:hypothetical protein
MSIKELMKEDSERAELMLRGYLGALDSDEDPSLSSITVTASCRTEIASIRRVDYTRFATREMILATLHQKNLYNVSTKEVQATFLEQKKWSLFKQSIVKSLLK